MVYRCSRNFFSIISPRESDLFYSEIRRFHTTPFFATSHVELLICDDRLTESKYFAWEKKNSHKKYPQLFGGPFVIETGGNPGETLISWQISP